MGYGGDSSKVQERLVNIKEIRASPTGFAALSEDGAVASWGSEEEGTTKAPETLEAKAIAIASTAEAR